MYSPRAAQGETERVRPSIFPVRWRPMTTAEPGGGMWRVACVGVRACVCVCVRARVCVRALDMHRKGIERSRTSRRADDSLLAGRFETKEACAFASP